jgi:hypothetical protein
MAGSRWGSPARMGESVRAGSGSFVVLRIAEISFGLDCIYKAESFNYLSVS